MRVDAYDPTLPDPDEPWDLLDLDPDPDEQVCNGHGCIIRADGLHHDKINGPHYWCRDCDGCESCEPSGEG